ncbi:hypothetical protein JXR93_04900, partial [bacterium]|nr:hypothetical protein [bacterium]
MKYLILIIVTLILSNLIFAENPICKKEKKETLNYILTEKIDGIYIPKDINDCFKELDKILNKEEIELIKKDISNLHFGLGMSIRNSWKLWRGSRLSKYFNDLGVYHADYISGIILRNYQLYLLKKDLKFKEDIESLSYHEIISMKPPIRCYPNGIKNLHQYRSIRYFSDFGKPR